MLTVYKEQYLKPLVTFFRYAGMITSKQQLNSYNARVGVFNIADITCSAKHLFALFDDFMLSKEKKREIITINSHPC